MKKNTLYILVILMAISLAGIIWVQWYWISNGIAIKEKQFDQLVNTSLNDAVTALENKESVLFLANQFNEFTSDIVIKSDTTQRHIVWSSSDADSLNISKIVGSNEDVMIKVEAISDSIIGENHQIKTSKKVIINNKVITDEIEGEDILGERFDNIMVKMVKEFKRRENPIEHFIGKTNLDSLTTYHLNENGINSTYDYAIINNDTIINKYSSDNYHFTGNNYQIPLFKHDLSAKPSMLSISFTNKKMVVLKSMWAMVLISIVFTLIILLCFSGALYFMFKQKKIAEIKNDFINNMTHEFKTPISTISLAVDSITHPKIIIDKTQINYYADIIRQENKRMNRQVESVLNTSLAEKDELTLQKTSVHVKDLFDKIEHRMYLQLSNVNAQLTINDATENTTFIADEIHLQNAICNILDNAIKYSNNQPIIIIQIRKTPTEISFEINDKGIGMSKEIQKKVFDKFFRVQTGNIHNVKGFGIGLSYVKAIIEAHHGEILLASKLNEGTSITIKLPVV
jgi:two-component system, OmpR family, phosphate regulon sensor histidine kinase PhoR